MFFSGNFEISPFNCHHLLIHNVGFHEREFQGVLILSNKLTYLQIQDSTEVLPILRGAQVGFSPSGLVNFAKTCRPKQGRSQPASQSRVGKISTFLIFPRLKF